MAKNKLIILLCILSSMVRTNALAQDFSAENSDGVTIFYSYINNGKELEVRGIAISSVNAVVIPEEVTYMDKTRKVTKIGQSAFLATFI